MGPQSTASTSPVSPPLPQGLRRALVTVLRLGRREQPLSRPLLNRRTRPLLTPRCHTATTERQPSGGVGAHTRDEAV